MGRFH